MRERIRMGMIGGGRGAFIGAVHRMAAALDGQIELVCGAFSSDPERSRQSGADLFLEPDRCYPDFAAMMTQEAALPAHKRMQFVSIVTPNHLHVAPAKMALEAGFHVVCDKPLCLTLQEAKELESLVSQSGLIFAVTHAYAGYPMVKQARYMIQQGIIGQLRRVVVEYSQGWLSTPLETSDQKQAAWRTDPLRSGIAGAMGDIGTHAAHLAEYVSGLEIESVCADLHTHVAGRRLDDDGSVLLRMSQGVRGVLMATQIAAGEENNLRLRVYGEKGSLDWSQMEPNTLTHRKLDGHTEVLRTGVGPLADITLAHTRIPAGHPEGYLEAFANIYRNVAYCVDARNENKEVDSVYLDYPTIAEGLRGMAFIEAVVRSSKEDREKWVSL